MLQEQQILIVINNFYNKFKNYNNKIKIIKKFEKEYLAKSFPENSIIFLPF